jgi:ABC-type amino acid transport substrate-binding protein
MNRRRGFEKLRRAALRWAVATSVLATTGFAWSAGSSPTLTAIKSRGWLVCGVNEGLPGFSYLDERGVWTGFDVDFCRAIAAAIFGDPKKAKLVPLTADARFQAGERVAIDCIVEVGDRLNVIALALIDEAARMVGLERTSILPSWRPRRTCRWPSSSGPGPGTAAVEFTFDTCTYKYIRLYLSQGGHGHDHNTLWS